MAVNINNTPYSNFATRSVNDRTRQRETGNKARGVAENRKTDVNQPKLSKAAQELLDRIKAKYGNMDVMVADYANDDEAQSILARGTKEFSALFSTDELEKMAADKDYEKANMDKLDSAMQMSEEISKKYSENGDDKKGMITRVGISFNQDGTVSYFAELENLSSQQRERIDKMREERAEEKKEAQREEDEKRGLRIPVKKTVVKASSQEELLDKLNEVDWSKVHATGKTEGARFDLSI